MDIIYDSLFMMSSNHINQMVKERSQTTDEKSIMDTVKKSPHKQPDFLAKNSDVMDIIEKITSGYQVISVNRLTATHGLSIKMASATCENNTSVHEQGRGIAEITFHDF